MTKEKEKCINWLLNKIINSDCCPLAEGEENIIKTILKFLMESGNGYK